MAEAKEKVRLSVKEIVWLVISLVIVAGGLTLIILNFIAEGINNAGIDNKFNPLYQANIAMINATKMGWLYWGLIILGVGVVVLLIVLNYFASVADKTGDRQRRGKGRRILTEEDVRQAVEVKEASAE